MVCYSSESVTAELQHHRSEIVLIGPCGSGKSTIGGLLAERLNLPSVSMDDLCQGYYAEAPEHLQPKQQSHVDSTLPKRYREGRWKDLYALDRLLSDYRDCVFNLGAGHSIYEEPSLFRQAHDLLMPFDHVVLLMPSPNPEDSIAVLRDRTIKVKGWDCTFEGFDFHEHFVRHESNRRLAKFCVYTNSKSPDQTCDEILSLLSNRSEGVTGHAATRPESNSECGNKPQPEAEGISQ